jgi:hypothetical protein
MAVAIRKNEEKHIQPPPQRAQACPSRTRSRFRPPTTAPFLLHVLAFDTEAAGLPDQQPSRRSIRPRTSHNFATWIPCNADLLLVSLINRRNPARVHGNTNAILCDAPRLLPSVPSRCLRVVDAFACHAIMAAGCRRHGGSRSARRAVCGQCLLDT